MEGTVWIASYVIVCFTLTGLVLGVAATYREVGAARATQTPWPFATLGPGQLFPLAGMGISPAHSTNGDVRRHSGHFYLFVGFEDDAVPAAMSTAIAAAAWRVPYTVIVPADGEPEWIATLPADVCDRVVKVDAGDARPLGVRKVPTLAFVKEDRVVDAAADLFSPQLIRDHFRLAAEPFEMMPRIFGRLGEHA